MAPERRREGDSTRAVDADVDLAIVGNGAIGCALALHFGTVHADARVALVGASARVGSASLAAGAMLNVFTELDETSLETPAARAKFAIGLDATRSWPNHLALLNRRLDGTGLPPVELHLGTHVIDAGASPTFDAIVRALRAHAEPFSEVDRNGGPPLPFARAILLPREGMVSSRHLHRAYDAALAQMPNVDVVDANVDAIEVGATRGERPRLVTSAGELRARVVVLAAGTRTQDLVDRLGLGGRIPRVVAGIGVALVVRAAPPAGVVRCVGGPYLVPWDGEHLYVGATSLLAAEGTTRAPADAVPSLLASLARHAGRAFSEAPIVETLVGWRPTTLDTYPLLGPTTIDGVWLATGTRRDGLHQSPRIAEELTRCIGSGEAPFGGRFMPERSLLLDVPRELAIARTACGAVSRRDVLDVYERTGLASGDAGIPPEVFEMYRLGVADANLAFRRATT